MSDGPPRGVYWASVLAMALIVLVAASAAASNDVFPFAKKQKKAVAWKTTNSRSGKAVIRMTAIKPGQTGAGRVIIANTGKQPIKRMLLTQDRAAQKGISRSLQLQVFDTTTKRCLYPAQKQKKGKRVARRCTSWAGWVGGRKLKNVPVTSKRGKTWRPRERHVIEVRWRLALESPNGDQKKTATFRLKWRARA